MNIYSPVYGLPSYGNHPMISKPKGSIEKRRPTHILSPERKIELEQKLLDWNQAPSRVTNYTSKDKRNISLKLVDKLEDRVHRRTQHREKDSEQK